MKPQAKPCALCGALPGAICHTAMYAGRHAYVEPPDPRRELTTGCAFVALVGIVVLLAALAPFVGGLP